ncbi:unnamed protein product [Phytomonas sp. EM1]|nr:unnamed protein product [Phytomonas sp. EM1]|eukprot:CCW61062.1 unnamed protein product [Phytomonas sp. isolate EM1]
MLRGAKTGYLFPSSHSRNFPAHGYTVASLCKARFHTNTSSLVLTVGFLLPTLTSVNQKLEKHVNQGDDISMKELMTIFVESGQTNLIAFADRLTRVALETVLACVLIERQTAFADSVVYVWDLYPRLHTHYVGELFQLLCVPRFLATLLGPSPSQADLDFVTADVAPLAAVEDVMKRRVIAWTANVVVDLARLVWGGRGGGGQIKDIKTAALTQVVLHTTTTLCGVIGAGIGRGIGGGRGEYWGELLALACVPMVNVGYAVRMVRRQGGGGAGVRGATAPSTGGHRHHHRRGGGERTTSMNKPAVAA